MTAQDLLANVHSDDPRELFLYFALHATECRTKLGTQLTDLSDFTSFLVELADAFKPEALDKTCPRCGHLHEGYKECGKFISESTGFCRCELEVPA